MVTPQDDLQERKTRRLIIARGFWHCWVYANRPNDVHLAVQRPFVLVGTVSADVVDLRQAMMSLSARRPTCRTQSDPCMSINAALTPTLKLHHRD